MYPCTTASGLQVYIFIDSMVQSVQCTTIILYITNIFKYVCSSDNLQLLTAISSFLMSSSKALSTS